MYKVLLLMCVSLILSGCPSGNVSYKLPIPDPQLTSEPCNLDTGLVSNTNELLVQDRENWECAGSWLQSVYGWQLWYDKTKTLYDTTD